MGGGGDRSILSPLYVIVMGRMGKAVSHWNSLQLPVTLAQQMSPHSCLLQYLLLCHSLINNVSLET